MLVYQQREFLIFMLHSFLSGVCLGAVYDIFRISRIIFGVNVIGTGRIARLYDRSYPVIGRIATGSVASKSAAGVLTFFEDILFFVIAAAFVLTVTFFGNDGKIRVEALTVTAFGFLLYYVSVGRLTTLFSSYIAFLIRIVTAYIRFAIMLPLRIACGILKKIFIRLREIILLRIRAYIILMESKKYTSYMMSLSRKAFLNGTPYKTRKWNGISYGTEKKI